MKLPHSSQLQKWGGHLAFMICGLMIGALIFLYTHAHMLDNILLENRRLALEVTKLLDEVAYLEKRAEDLDKLSQQEITVKQIEIIIVNEDQIDGFAATDIIKQLREDLKYLTQENYSVQSVGETAETHARLINGRTIRFEDNSEYRIRLVTMIIYSTITFKIHVQKIN
jgi:hypothetical protein